MQPSTKRIRITGVALLVVCVVAIYLAITAINGVPAFPYKIVTATFRTASNLVPHDDVRIDGARVGQVSATTYDAQSNTTKVVMQVQPGHSVYANGQAAIGDVSALGAEYVALTPGDKSAGPLPAGGIPVEHTQIPVEIDSVLDVFGPKQADAASAALQTLGTGFNGEAQPIRDILTNAPTLLPNVSTTTQTLTDPGTALIPFIRQTQQLTAAFQGRQQQLAQLLDNLNTTFAALDTQNGQAIQSTINTAAPVLPQLTPALNDLGGAAATTAVAVHQLAPGAAALGSGTPDLRAFLREAVPPLKTTPSVATQAIPGVKGLAGTLNLAQTTYPVAPFISQLAAQANPLLGYLAPYTSDMTTLWDDLTNGLGKGDQFGNWLPFSSSFDNRSTDGGAADDTGTGPGQSERCAYPAPGIATNLRTPASKGC
jgi:phospholipid/cholesterol/gamma-HCH transport system substrate-binding protein